MIGEKINLKNYRTAFILLAILAVGLSLRIYGLSRESIWYDEAGSAYYAEQNTSQLLETVTTTDCTPPLYFIALHYWVSIFGVSEFSLRFPSVIFGLLSILLIYQIGTILFNKNVGLLTALILALSSFHIYYSQEARSYNLMAFLTLLSFYFLIKILRKRKLIFSAGYITASILLIYTHIFGVFIIIAQNVYVFTLLLVSKKANELNIKRWIIFQCIIVAAYTPWIILGLFNQINYVEHYHWYLPPKIGEIINTFVVYSGPSKVILIFLLAFIFLSSLDFIRLGQNFSDRKTLFDLNIDYNHSANLLNAGKIYFLLIWLFIPLIIPFLTSLLITPIYVIRHTISSSFAFYLLAGKGLEYVIEKYSKFKWLKFSIVLLLILFSSIILFRNYHYVKKTQWREATNYVNQKAEPGDLVVFYPGEKFILYAFNFYSKRTDLIEKPFLLDTVVNEINVKSLVKFSENYKRLWVIQRLEDRKGIIKRNLSKSKKLLYHKIFRSKNYQSGNKALELSLFENKISDKL